jgi:hypothetical protein
LTPAALMECRDAANIAKSRAPGIEMREAWSIAVLHALQNPHWWTRHNRSWRLQTMKGRIFKELLERPRAMRRAEQAFYEGHPTPIMVSFANGAGRQPCSKPGHVRRVVGGKPRCWTCHLEGCRRNRRKRANS